MKGKLARVCEQYPRAQLTIELAAIAFLVLVIALIPFNIAIAIEGTVLADAAARDAGRAAGSTASASAGLKAAQSSCRSHITDGYWVTPPVIEGGSITTDKFGNSRATDF